MLRFLSIVLFAFSMSSESFTREAVSMEDMQQGQQAKYSVKADRAGSDPRAALPGL